MHLHWCPPLKAQAQICGLPSTPVIYSRCAHSIPFYIAAPVSTVDATLPDGSGIPIEERATTEVTHFQGQRVAAPGIEVGEPSVGIDGASMAACTLHHGPLHGSVRIAGQAREPHASVWPTHLAAAASGKGRQGVARQVLGNATHPLLKPQRSCRALRRCGTRRLT